VRKILNEYYRKRRLKMDAGADVAWPERKVACLSGLQFAMDLFFRDEAAFWAEYQNQPQERSADSDEATLTADEIARRINQLPRNQIPLKAQHLVAFTDVHQDLLFWKIMWFADDFTAGVVDYGTWPDQQRLQFKLRDAKPTIRQATGLRSVLPSIRKALDTLATELLARRFKRPDGVTLQISRLGEDANWGKGRNTVYEHAREHPQNALIRPCHGKGIGVTDAPMSDYKVGPGEKAGFHWIRKSADGKWYLLVDTNFWKSFAHDGLCLSFEEQHSISLYNAKPHEHRLLAEHCSAETRKTGKDKKSGREVDVWSDKPGSPDNHWWDTLVGCCVIASELGVVQRTTPKEKKKRLTAAEIRERRSQSRAA
jgi:hypothetical protein